MSDSKPVLDAILHCVRLERVRLSYDTHDASWDGPMIGESRRGELAKEAAIAASNFDTALREYVGKP